MSARYGRVLKQIMEDPFEEMRALFQDGSRKTSRRGKEKVTVTSSGSSDASTPKSNRRLSKEQHDSRRPEKSALAQKRKRLS